MPACLVQGASRGIGLEFCMYLLRGVPNITVIATCRNPGGATDLRALQGLLTTFSTNAIGPLLVGKYFSPLLQKGTGAFGQHAQNKQTHAAVMANISAKVGSITDNGLGGWYSYRMSKCALNMATKNLSIELGRGRNKVICVSLHPGTVDTELSRPYHK
ncbi:Hypp2183 [Branchiostoma lanceolatum]|uniref:Hypp2183 protein n=1 Tax=Branchiostoma lanceolatum TaxID=7740 RepID=A0A8J9ZP82_BRALA|nr:Hypp2183 [Branchiostoma lanceolatum]